MNQGDHLGMNDSIKAVCFPPAALSACSFDRELMESMGETIGREAQANDVSVVLFRYIPYFSPASLFLSHI